MRIYKRPESVLVVIYSANGGVLLLQRRDVPTFWQSVTGSLKADESPFQAAARELYEETALQGGLLYDCQQSHSFAIIPPWSARYAPGTTHNIEFVFRYLVPQTCAVRLNPDEHLAWRWLPKNMALALVTSETNRAAIAAWVPDSLS
jgi:dihydroneopterin triphosphate diphosphatase